MRVFMFFARDSTFSLTQEALETEHGLRDWPQSLRLASEAEVGLIV